MSRFSSCHLVCLLGASVLAAGCGQDSVAPSSTVPRRALPGDPVRDWLDANGKPFEGPHLSLPHQELEFMRALVGDARIVSLGENTHGARDFFEMKARLLRFLVEEMGFNTFGIEATWPEARLLDRYVRTGEGDARELLQGLFFWTWRTESVLEMIEWMRAHNEAGGDVGFHGFDMQFPGLALENVRAYFREVDPDRVGIVNEHIQCLDAFANDERGRFPTRRYASQPLAYQRDCAASLQEVRNLLFLRRAQYEAASGTDAFEVALQSLRVAVQYHLDETGEQDRDESMAENVGWISDRIGPDGRMVLWAHNYHVSTQEGAQGHFMRQAFGDDMVVVGFSHARGHFTAITRTGSQYRGLAEHELDEPVEGSFESYLERASAPRFVLDLRDLGTILAGNSWLTETRPFRGIGAVYDPDEPGDYWHEAPLREWYDVIIHFESTRATAVLPTVTPRPEPVPDPTAAEEWIETSAVPFHGTHFSLPHRDLAGVGEVVGEARIVALGENTYGTRDFHQMKARLFRYLVEEKGFDTFALEGTWPETRLLNRYLQTGEGDPHRLLSGMHFWVWRSESMLELIKWMRAYNEDGGHLEFHGFDMQYPGLALRNVREYLRSVDPERAASVEADLNCLETFANDHTGRFPSSRYADQTEIYRSACGDSLEAVREDLVANRNEYEAASDEDAFAVALQSLRVAVQYHLMSAREQSRSESMAENIAWINGRVGPGGGLVLWAHNSHFARNPAATGFHLHEMFGDDLLSVAFGHESGQFTAVTRRGSEYVGQMVNELSPPIPHSFEYYLAGASASRLVLDLRTWDASSPGSAWLGDLRPFRNIGCCYDPDTPESYWRSIPLARWYDVLIFFKSTRPAVVLPALTPDPW